MENDVKVKNQLKRLQAGNRCSLPHCKLSKRIIPTLKLYKFPSYDSSLFKVWVEKCKFTEEFVANSASLRICEKHFSPDMKGPRYLKSGSIPNLCLEDNLEDVENVSAGNENKNELLLLKSPPRKRKRTESSTSVDFCRFCLKSNKTIRFYKNKHSEGIKKIGKLKIENQKLKKENILMKRCIYRLQKKEKESHARNNLSLNEQIDQLDVGKNNKIFSKMLLKRNRGSSSLWNDNEKTFAQSIYYKSSSMYKYLRDSVKLNLPHISSLCRWTVLKNLQPGNNECLLNILKNIVENMDENSKQCVLLFDEISIRKALSYNSSVDIIDGLVDLGKERKNEIGSYICVFMIRGLLKNWKFVLNYYVSKQNIKGEDLVVLVKENLQTLMNIGFKVRAITCDQGGNNRNCFSKLAEVKTVNKKPFFYFNFEKIYLLYDVPHLLKSIRNIMLSANLKTPDGLVSFDVIKELFDLEQSKITKMTKLTYTHINPSTFEKMRVNIATQTLSHTVASAIETTVKNKQFTKNSNEIALATAKFIKKINDVFDCLNARHYQDPNPLKRGLQKNGIVFQTLLDFLSYLKEIQYDRSTVYCLKGIEQTICGVLSLAKEIFRSNKDLFFLLTSHLNQDPLENLFGSIRAKGGHNKNPSVHEFSLALAKLMQFKMLKFNLHFNCQEDDIQMLDIDFKNICEEMQIEHNYNENDSELVSLNTVIEKHVEYFDKSFDEFESKEIPIELTSSRYFVGYVASKAKCSACREIMIKSEEVISAPSEIFISEKNYSSRSIFGKLNAPSNLFFEVCKIHIKVFEEIFKEKRHLKNIRQIIVRNCVTCTNQTTNFTFWFDEKDFCFRHRMQTLEFLITVLLRKHCYWSVTKYTNSKNQKVKNLSHT